MIDLDRFRYLCASSASGSDVDRLVALKVEVPALIAEAEQARKLADVTRRAWDAWLANDKQHFPSDDFLSAIAALLDHHGAGCDPDAIETSVLSMEIAEWTAQKRETGGATP